MPFSYKRLWKLLIDRDMNKTEYRKALGISSGTLAKMTNGENVSLDIIERTCKLFGCRVEDIIEYVED